MDIEEKIRNREAIERLNRRKDKIKLETLGGSLIVASALATALAGNVIVDHKDVGYYFTSNDVNITQENLEDYHSKVYDVIDSNGNRYVIPIDVLEVIEPNVNGSYTFLTEDNYENLPENSNLGIKRIEDNSNKMVYNVIAFPMALAGLGLIYNSHSRIAKIEQQKASIRSGKKR